MQSECGLVRKAVNVYVCVKCTCIGVTTDERIRIDLWGPQGAHRVNSSLSLTIRISSHSVPRTDSSVMYSGWGEESTTTNQTFTDRNLQRYVNDYGAMQGKED